MSLEPGFLHPNAEVGNGDALEVDMTRAPQDQMYTGTHSTYTEQDDSSQGK